MMQHKIGNISVNNGDADAAGCNGLHADDYTYRVHVTLDEMMTSIAQLWQRDRAVVVCCAYARKVYCAVVGSCYTSGRSCTEHVYVAKSAFFEGVGQFRRIFLREGASPTNHCWYQKTRLIALSCGIKISVVHHYVLSQYTHLTDRRTDGRNCDSNTVRCITCCRAVKTKLHDTD